MKSRRTLQIQNTSKMKPKASGRDKMSKQLKFAISLTLLARKFCLSNIRRLKVSTKKDGEVYTTVDLGIEDLLADHISQSSFNYPILAEEKHSAPKSAEYLWIIDPVDGTANMSRGIPHYATSIALAKNGKIIVGVVINLATGELFYAQKGQGAFLKNPKVQGTFRKRQAIAVSNEKQLQQAVVGVDWVIHQVSHDTGVKLYDLFTPPTTFTVRHMACASLDICYVACGRYDAYVCHKLSPWDYAAAALILEEAGGRITDFNNKTCNLHTTNVLASNNRIHSQIKGTLAKI